MSLEIECPDKKCNGVIGIYPNEGVIYNNRDNKHLGHNACPECGKRIEIDIKAFIIHRGM